MQFRYQAIRQPNQQSKCLPVAMFMLVCVFVSLLVSPDRLLAQDDKWTEDFYAAVKQAKDEDKDVLVLFTGSDWCPPCKKLEEEVLSQADFLFEADQAFVLVRLDFPKTIVQSEELVKQNREVAQGFGVTSYPTVILIDPELRPYGITGYEEGGVINYLGALEELRQKRILRDEKLKEAESVEGLDRATLLDEAIAGIHEEIVNVYYEDIVAEIVEIDKDDELGLRSKYNAQKESEMRKIIIADVRTTCRLEKPENAIDYINEVLDQFEFPAAEKLQVLQLKLNVIRKTDDIAMLDAVLDEMIGLDGVEGDTHERLVVKKILLMTGSGREVEAMQLLDQSLLDGGSNMYLLLAKGELQYAAENFGEAIETFDLAMVAARENPDALIEAVAGKADAQYAADEIIPARQTLDNFADNTRMPSDLRSEALLHKAMMYRDSDQKRQAILAENRAISIAESPSEKAEVEKLVQRLRARFEGRRP